ncbi:hypothetical protein BDV95DRAFT_599904 [Massariosphaeria phaeospora]|uniref:Uncharacterized protein n=1 Tax=Massariosphaeria phaeospora TaxID=100035 RepID=A0A7C8I2L2_9PLEO|nr:hypothetical protein BDV95DRAFT_599904 [Massariosphaeria phaeospora]
MSREADEVTYAALRTRKDDIDTRQAVRPMARRLLSTEELDPEQVDLNENSDCVACRRNFLTDKPINNLLETSTTSTNHLSQMDSAAKTFLLQAHPHMKELNEKKIVEERNKNQPVERRDVSSGQTKAPKKKKGPHRAARHLGKRILKVSRDVSSGQKTRRYTCKRGERRGRPVKDGQKKKEGTDRPGRAEQSRQGGGDEREGEQIGRRADGLIYPRRAGPR